ncbi:MAG: glycosyltransferase family protein [Nanoarchaeota archaeon]
MKILFGVIDWGLGHATRDIPLIEGLLSRGHSIDVISTGRALKVLKDKFGARCNYFDVVSLYVPPVYSNYFLLGCAMNLHKMAASILRARKKINKIIKKGKYDWIISDNRFELYDKLSNSVIITHTLNFDNNLLKYPINKVMKFIMKPYSIVIVPDFPKKRFEGTMSDGKNIKKELHYIGVLSQIKKKHFKKDIDYFISLSGPEPQRTILQNKLIKQCRKLKGNIVIAGANPDVHITKNLGKNIKFYSFLNTQYQEEMMNRAKFVITRAGISTTSNMIELGKKKALLIPHPGQPEQEYLADLYEEKKYFHHVHQEDVDLERDIKVAMKGFKGFRPPWRTKKSVKKFIKIIEKR